MMKAMSQNVETQPLEDTLNNSFSEECLDAILKESESGAGLENEGPVPFEK